MSNNRADFLENNYYHIYNRGFEKRIIFRSDRDFERFIKYIKHELSLISSIKIIGYCILPNHFHFVLHNKETGLFISNFMRKIQGSYAMYYKNKYKTGLREPIFEGRFKSKMISSQTYLEQCLAYVVFNPLKHEIVNNIDDYKWSSYHQINKSQLEKYKDLQLDELEL